MSDQWLSHRDYWGLTATSHARDPPPYHTILPLRHSWQGWDMSDQWLSHRDYWGLTATSHARDPTPYHTTLPLRHSWQGWDMSDQWWSRTLVTPHPTTQYYLWGIPDRAEICLISDWVIEITEGWQQHHTLVTPHHLHTTLPLRHSWQGWDMSDQWWSHWDKWVLTVTSHLWPPTLPHNITSEAFLTGLRYVWSVMESSRLLRAERIPSTSVELEWAPKNRSTLKTWAPTWMAVKQMWE